MERIKGRVNPDPVPAATKQDLLVVGIGASAGGIQALRTFFSNVTRDSGNAYVVILHLSPEHESQLAEVLQMKTPIPVKQVKDRKIKVGPNCVYVIPPDRGLEITDGHLATTRIGNRQERRAPVDMFFRTLAESHKNHAVSVILTGTGPNGSMGIKRIKEMGGIVVVQDPREAEYPDMPRNALATGLVDYVLPIKDIPQKINEYKERLGKAEIAVDHNERPIERDERALREIFVLLRTRSGHDFTNYKRATVLRRIERRMNVNGKVNLPEYAELLRDSQTESQSLLKDLLISVTNFFRDPAAWEVLERDVIPRILAGKGRRDSVRVWVAGCATGEEAYSVAFLLAERLMGQLEVPSVQIFATDIDEAAIAQARSALYTESDVADVSPERLRQFFQKEQENYRVRRDIREMVLFAVHNVTKDPPFSRLDLANCRNLLIYLNRQAQSRVLQTLHFALKPGGYLFLGSSESADTDENLFAPVNKENRIFQARPVAARLTAPVPEISQAFLNQLTVNNPDLKKDEVRVLERLSYTALHQHLLEQYAPPSLVVNGDYDIVHLSERAGRYLQITGGEPSKNLLQVLRPELGLELRTALYQAVQQQSTVNIPNLRVKTEDGFENINVIVRPVTESDDPNRGFILIIFEPSSEPHERAAPLMTVDEPVARRLEKELLHTKSQLRATIEQYEVQHEELKSSNEELQAINEELRSAAEEIETSKEELQSVNEELSTVNQELKIKIEELSQSNNDLQNLINSTAVGTIFLDRRLRVKLFTQSVTDIFNLIPADIARPLTDLKSKLRSQDLAKSARKVLSDLQPIEREVESEDGRWYSMRIQPYRTNEDRIEGVVLTFIDITARREQEQELRESRDRMNEIIENIGDGFFAVDDEFNFIYINAKGEQMLGRPGGSLIGKNLWKEFPADAEGKSFEMHKKALDENRPVQYEFYSESARRWLRVHLYPDRRGGVSDFIRDITDERAKLMHDRMRDEQLRMIFESATDYAIFTIDKNGLVTTWNKGAEKTFGFTEQEIIGHPADILFTPEDRRRREPEREMKTALEKGRAEDERWHLRKDGTQFFASGVMQPLDPNKDIGFVKICRDQTEKLAAEDALRDRLTLRRLISTQEDERKRISRDLHDHLGQQLTALRLKIEGLKANYGSDPAIIKAFDETQGLAKQIDDDLSFLTWELRPTALDNLGLRNALASFVSEWSKNYGIPAEFHTARLRSVRMLQESEINLYRIAQEALNNVLKHANATKVNVLLEFSKGDVVLVIEDNGKGFNPQRAARRRKDGKGLGIVGMRERAALLGGTLQIESGPGKGTTVIARVPVRVQDLKGTQADGGA